jgi:predicted exporter
MNARLLSSKPIALGWLLLVALVVVLALRQGANFDSSILSLLPESGQDPLVHRAGEQMNRDFSERLLIVLSGADEDALRVAVADMAAALSPLVEVARVDWRIDDGDPGRLRKELFPYRFVLLGAQWERLEKYFELSGNIEGQQWQAVLTPRDAIVGQLFNRVELQGAGLLELVVLHEAGGDITRIYLDSELE